MPKTRINIECDNFDFYFLKCFENITLAGREAIPKDIFFKLFDSKGNPRIEVIHRLPFLTKLFILWQSFNKKWWVVVQDEADGLGLEEFKEYLKSIKKRDFSLGRSTEFEKDGNFYLANKQLGDVFSYLNSLSVSPAYNYLVKGKNKTSTKSADWSEQVEYIAAFISNYESNRKKMALATNISMPEWFVLTSLFHGKEMVGAILYTQKFKKAFQSSPSRIKTSFGSLQSKGLIEKIGANKGATLKITALGRSKVVQMLERFALNS